MKLLKLRLTAAMVLLGWPAAADLQQDLANAAKKNDTKRIRKLLEKGANPSVALLHAIQNGHPESAQLLLKYGADVSARTQAVSVQSISMGYRIQWVPKGKTPLILAIEGRNEQLVELLLAKGASPNDRAIFPNPRLPFHSVPGGVTEVQTNMDVALLKDVTYSPLELAIALAQPNLVRLLVTHGVDVNAKDEDGIPAILLAHYTGQSEIYKMLMDAGANNPNIPAESAVVEKLRFKLKSIQ